MVHRHTVLAWYLVGAVGCGAPASSQLTAEHGIAIEDSVRQFLQEYAAQANSGDLAGVLDFYASDPAFHWVENGAITYESHKAVTTAFESLAPRVEELRLEFDELRVVALGPGVAALTAAYRQMFSDTAGAVFDVAGVVTFIAVHREVGWKFIAGHTSQPRAPER
jgi:uncharacterized protein (TIGR02246 family)